MAMLNNQMVCFKIYIETFFYSFQDRTGIQYDSETDRHIGFANKYHIISMIMYVYIYILYNIYIYIYICNYIC